MTLENKPFTRYNEEKKIDSFTIRLNEEERKVLNVCKRIIQQPKDSTAIKTLALIGAKVIHSPEIEFILDTIYSNKRKNKRIGIAEIE